MNCFLNGFGSLVLSTNEDDTRIKEQVIRNKYFIVYFLKSVVNIIGLTQMDGNAVLILVSVECVISFSTKPKRVGGHQNAAR